MATRRTTHRSKSGKKLYAVRGKQGEFADIETYERAHGQDVKRRSQAERARKKTAAKGKKTAARPARKSKGKAKKK